MGGGSSAAAGAKYANAAEGGAAKVSVLKRASSSGSKDKLDKASEDRLLRDVASEPKDCLWHKKNCCDDDMKPVRTIREAYPFDNKTVAYQKIEKVYRVQDRCDKWGQVRVNKLGPPKLFCDFCGHFIVDRQSEALFYVCMSCKKHDRQFELCVECHDNKVLRTECRRPSKGRARTDSDEEPTMVQVISSTTSTQPPSSVRTRNRTWTNTSTRSRESDEGPDRRMRLIGADDHVWRGSTKSSKEIPEPSAGPSTVVSSGKWAAELTENRSTRKEVRDLSFCCDGSLSGSVSSGGTLTGTFSTDPQRGTPSACKWTEVYDWGSMHVEGTFVFEKHKASIIRATFTASDGGKGSMQLRAPK